MSLSQKHLEELFAEHFAKFTEANIPQTLRVGVEAHGKHVVPYDQVKDFFKTVQKLYVVCEYFAEHPDEPVNMAQIASYFGEDASKHVQQAYEECKGGYTLVSSWLYFKVEGDCYRVHPKLRDMSGISFTVPRGDASKACFSKLGGVIDALKNATPRGDYRKREFKRDRKEAEAEAFRNKVRVSFELHPNEIDKIVQNDKFSKVIIDIGDFNKARVRTSMDAILHVVRDHIETVLAIDYGLEKIGDDTEGAEEK